MVSCGTGMMQWKSVFCPHADLFLPSCMVNWRVAGRQPFFYWLYLAKKIFKNLKCVKIKCLLRFSNSHN
jgi:hypothetical protein